MLSKAEYKRYKLAHKNMWSWLADNPGARKRDWPEWCCTTVVSIPGECFACVVADIRRLSIPICRATCDFCPLDQEIMRQCGTGSAYRDWELLTREYNNLPEPRCEALRREISTQALRIKNAWSEKS
jgi:hypothetical protein